MFGGLNLANATAGGPMSYGMFGGGNAAPAASGGLLGQLSQPQQLNRPMAMPSGGPNVQQTKPVSAMGGVGFGQAMPFVKSMTLPGGGPNTPTPLPTPVEGPMPEIGPAEPTNPIVRAICGLPPVPSGSGGGGFVRPTFGGGILGSFGGGDNPSPNTPPTPLADLFNRPLPSLGGGMAPAVPQPVDFGLGGQQMGFGNGMGSMNNWFSNFTAPRPPAPAPMMPMKGMFGVR